MWKRKKRTYVGTSIQPLNDDPNKVLFTKDLALVDYIHTERPGLPKESYPEVYTQYWKNSVVHKAKAFRRYAEQGKSVDGTVKNYTITKSKNINDIRLQAKVSGLINRKVTADYISVGDANVYDIISDILRKKYLYHLESNRIIGLEKEFTTRVYLKDYIIKYTQLTLDSAEDITLIEPRGMRPTSGYTPSREYDVNRGYTPFEVVENNLYDYVDIYYTLRSTEDFTTHKDYVDRVEVIQQGTTNSTTTNSTTPPPPKEYDYTFKFKENFLAYEYSGDGSIYATAGTSSTTPTVEAVSNNYITVGYHYTYKDTEYYDSYIYVLGSNTDDIFERYLTKTEVASYFMPRLHIRNNNYALHHDNLVKTDSFISRKRAAAKLGLDYKSFADNVMKDVNVDGDVEQAYLGFMLNLNFKEKLDKDNVLSEYMYSFFNKLHDIYITSDGSENDLLVELKDNLVAGHFRVGSISKSILNIEDIPEHRRPVFKTKEKYKVFKIHTSLEYEYLRSIGKTSEIPRGFEYVLRLRTAMNSLKGYYIYRKISDTQVEALHLKDVSYGDYIRDKWSEMSVDSEFLPVPLDMSILDLMNHHRKEILINLAMCLVFNIRKVVKDKWYQTGIFKIAMVVVSVVISVVTVGVGAPISAILMSIATGLVTSFAIGIAIQLAVKLLVKLGVDPRLVGVIALVGAIVFRSFQNIGNAAKATILSAKEILQAVNFAVKVHMEGTKQYMIQLNKEMQTFARESQEKWKEIDRAKELLGNGFDMVPYMSMLNTQSGVSDFIVGETSEKYLARKLETNPGLYIYDYTYNFVDIHLQLPSAHEGLSQQRNTYDMELSL